MRKTFKVEGMSCINCARTIEIGLKRKEGVKEVKVSFELGRVHVVFDENVVDEERIIGTIESLGYRVIDEEDDGRELLILSLCGLSSVLVVLLMLGVVPGGVLAQFLLSTLVQAVGGWKFYRGAYLSFSKGVAGMDVLVALGTSGAYLYSIFAISGLVAGSPFFETNIFLITCVRGGRFIEERVRKRATKLLRDMLSAQHSEVTVIEGSEEVRKKVREVGKGERVLYRAGDIILTDGKVVRGFAYVSEAVLTGEPEPVPKKEGDKVLSGSVVEDGFVEVLVERSYDGSYLSSIGRLIDSALGDKPKIQRFADRVSHYFVQFVIAMSLFVFLLWMGKTGDVQTATRFSLALLVISCPCALGIATPLAVAVGVSIALRKGILIKKPSLIEVFPKIDLLVFDKTGTLTEGKFRVTGSEIFSDKALDIAYSMERGSNHPVARAVRDFAREKGAKEIELGECKEVRGKGVVCGELFIGAPEKERGLKKVVLKRGGEVLAIFYLRDELRKEARDVVKEVKGMGIETVLLSGDGPSMTKRVAEEVGIDRFFASMTPEEKRERVRAFQKEGKVVAMVGDGINDAPALAQADLSFAVAQGTDITKRAGDVILLSGIQNLPFAFRLGRAVSGKIKQNLLWAFLYNVVSMPVAAGLFYNWGLYLKPELAGLMMSLSSLSVVLNTLLLKRL